MADRIESRAPQMIEQQVSRKKIELELKLASLEKELMSWCARSEKGGPLEKHHTQIRAVSAHLSGWHSSIRKRLEKYKDQEADVYLTNCANAGKLILSEHRIWEYFRSKFIQREEESFLKYLRAADEFAWACYQPIQQTVYPDPVKGKRKEPPLVFFNGGLSPFSVVRDKPFQPEQVADEILNIDPEDYITKLPISVVGVPWDQVSHLPAVLVLGHEVGHIVEADFGLEEGLIKALKKALEKRKADAERTAAWDSWLGEIFADLYGCLAGGPAFAGTLIDFIAKGKEAICSEKKITAGWGRYPTDFLRVTIILKALKLIGFGDYVSLNDYGKLWKRYQSNMDDAYTKDIDEIVPALLDYEHEVLSNKSIKQVFCFDFKKQQKAVDALIKEFSDTKLDTNVKIPSKDIRVLFAALRRAFEVDPEKYVASSYGDAMLTHITDHVIQKGVRAGEVKLTGQELKAKLESYEKDGIDLIESVLANAKIA